MGNCDTMNYFAFCYDNKFPDVLSNDDLIRLIQESQNGNIESRDIIIVSMLRLINKIAENNLRPGSELDDLIVVGIEGCIKAIEKFDIRRNHKFTTFMTVVVENDIRMYLRQFKRQYLLTSLDEPVNTNGDGILTLMDILEDRTTIQSPYEIMETDVIIKMIISEIEKMPEKQRIVMEYYYGLNGRQKIKQERISEILGCTQSYISRLRKKSIRSIQRKLKAVKVIL